MSVIAGVKEIKLLAPHISRYLNARPQFNNPNIIRVSQVKNLCPREEFWKNELRVQAEEGSENAKLQLLSIERTNHKPGDIQGIFDTGTVMHHQYQFYAGVIGMLIGRWRCAYCGTVEEGSMPRREVAGADGAPLMDAAPCDFCDGRNLLCFPSWFHVETEVCGPYGLVGHVDAIITDKSTGKVYVYDFKTINDNGFKELYEELPKADNVFQILVYAGLLKAKMKIDGAVLGYINKNSAGVKGMREFLIPYDDAPKDRAIVLAKAIRDAITGGKAPAESTRVCDSIKCTRAVSCQFAVQCFGKNRPINFLKDE